MRIGLFESTIGVLFLAGVAQALIVATEIPAVRPTPTTTTISTTTTTTTLPSRLYDSPWWQDIFGVAPAYAINVATTSSSPPPPPTKDEINTLRQAFAAFYGTTNRDVQAAEGLLTQSIAAWQRQPPNEQAGLYRVRGDCYMALLRPTDAIADYTQAVDLLLLAEGSDDDDDDDSADPSELPASYLGRGRAIRSLHNRATREQAQLAAQDYERALILSSRDDWDTDAENFDSGARTNPYAVWEYGMALRNAGNYDKAESMHKLASDLFGEIGDQARSAISAMDAGIDAASTSDSERAAILLKNGIQQIKSVEGRDIPLLQRVIAKEGESRMALASVLWTSGKKQDAESQLGLACQRLDQLEADAIARNKINAPLTVPPHLTFSIDDGVGALDISCTRLKNQNYLTERLEWPPALQQKVSKLYDLK